jgi:hypothetical protein
LLEQEAVVSRFGEFNFGFSWNRNGGTLRDAPVSRVLASLRVIKSKSATLPVALIQRCAATLTELDGHQMGDDAFGALSRCTRLESLTLNNWTDCPPAAWLGLSQLHTLSGVSLTDVSPTAIAAALPRLHTLHLYNGHGDFPVAAFYDELLPRLRSFHLEGRWPRTSDAAEMADVHPPPLLLLEDLKWRGRGVNLPRQLMGARPSTLNASQVDLVEWLQAADRASPASPASPADTSPLARVRALTLKLEDTPPETTFMARLLRAAPQLRQFSFEVLVRDHALWVLSDESTPESAFAGLVHLKLQHIAVFSVYLPVHVHVPDGCGVRLRHRHFPRLRRLTVIDAEYSV